MRKGVDKVYKLKTILTDEVLSIYENKFLLYLNISNQLSLSLLYSKVFITDNSS